MSRGQSYSFFIIEIIYFTLLEERKALMLGVLLNLMFYMISFSTPRRFFFSGGWWMVCILIMTVPNLSTCSWISSPTRVDAWEIVYTSHVQKAYRETINPKELKTWTPSTTHYPQNIIKVFGRIVRSYSNTRQ